MATSAVVFSGRNGLDFGELRSGVLRIPDVMKRVREAQAILDQLETNPVDLISVLSSGDDYFFRNIKLKGLMAAIVQTGLFDRMLKTQRRPEYMISTASGDSAMMVCAGLQTFQDLVAHSEALDTLKPPSPEPHLTLAAQPTPLLAGISLTEFRALGARKEADGQIKYQPVKDGILDLKKAVLTLNEEFGVTRFINVGPASALRSLDYNLLGTDEIEALDSIELDPLLGWFWRGMRAAQSSSSIAQ